MNFKVPEPTWARLGFNTPPDEKTSGKGVGIVIIDYVNSNGEFSYLGERIHQISVEEDLTVSCCHFNAYENDSWDESEHGSNVLRLLTHPPFHYQGNNYIGLAPAATYYILSEWDPLKLRKGIEWLVERKEKFNIKIIVNLLVPRVELFQNTSLDPYVKAFQSAIEGNVLIIAANGNSRAHNNLHPIEFFTIGGYNDNGSSNSADYEPHPVVPWGRNGDGHMRPDVLAPFTYLPVKLFNNELSYFSGSCGGSAIVAGLCANILSRFKEIDLDTFKSILINSGLALSNSENPALIIQAEKAIELIRNKSVFDGEAITIKIRATDAAKSIESEDPVKRALALTNIIEEKECSREMLWPFLFDESPIVRKNALIAIGKSLDKLEKEKLWLIFHNEKDSTGVREALLYALLENADSSELERWVLLIDDENIDVRLCVKLYLERFFENAPKLTHISINVPEIIAENSEAIKEWYMRHILT